MSVQRYAVADRHGHVLGETIRDTPEAARREACAIARRADATYWMPSGRVWTWSDLEAKGYRVEPVDARTPR